MVSCCDTQHGTMIGIWIFIVSTSAALAQDDNVYELIKNENGNTNKQTEIHGDLDKGCHDCYKCDDPHILNHRKKTTKLQLVGAHGTEDVCCIAHMILQARTGGDCGKRIPEGVADQNRAHIRAILEGEYPWRAWIWKKGEPTPFCAGVVVDTTILTIVTSASCALKYPASSVIVTFNRSLSEPIEVEHLLVHEEYDKDKPLVNNIALLYCNGKSRDKKAPSWVNSACVSNLPPMQATFCKVMSKEDYFIDTVVMERKKCEVDHKEPDVSQICTAIVKGDYEPEIGAGLFCQDRLRTLSNEYYVSGITLKISDEVIVYTNVSYFEQWIYNKIQKLSSTRYGI